MLPVEILFFAVVVASLPLCFARPWIGVLVFAWLGYMNPHRLLGGFLHNLPFAKMVAVATLAGLLWRREWAPLPRTRAVLLIAALWAVFACSTFLAATHPAHAREKFVEVSKVLLMTGVTLVLFQDRRKLHALLLVIAMSIGLIGFAGGVWAVLTRWPTILWGPLDSAISDNNALGFAIVMVLPMLAFLRDEEPRWWLRQALLVLFGFSIPAVYATYSRGAFINLLVVLAVIGIKRWKRDLALLTVMVTALALIGLAPHEWTERMLTITPAVVYNDSSGNQRMHSWYVALRLGLDHPVLGAGFWPFDPEVYGRYLPGYVDYHDAHNHFLQVLAEHGFPGLLLFSALLVCVFTSLRRVARLTRGDPERRWMAHYADLVEVSLIAYVVGGAFANMAYFDLMYQLVAVAIILDWGVRTGLGGDRAATNRTSDSESRPSRRRQKRAAPQDERFWPRLQKIISAHPEEVPSFGTVSKGVAPVYRRPK